MRNRILAIVVSLSMILNPINCIAIYAEEDIDLGQATDAEISTEGSTRTDDVTSGAEQVQNADTEQIEAENSTIQQELDTNVQSLSELSSGISEEDVNDRRYNSYFIAPFQYRNNTSEYISPSSGGLIIKNTDVVLPGRNGLDFELSTTYNSTVAYLYQTYRGYNDFDHTYLNSREISDEQKHYALGPGWTFNIPYLNLIGRRDDYYDIVAHLSSGETYLAYYSTWDRGYYFDEYEACDISISNYSGYEDLEYDSIDDSYFSGSGESQYAVWYKDGKVEIFNEKGYLICIMDRYGNKIRFGYQDVDNFNNGDSTVPNMIVDSLGRTIEFEYDKTDGRKVTIILPDNTSSTNSDNKRVQYILGVIPGTNEYIFTVAKRIDQMQRETSYTYIHQGTRFDYLQVGFDDERTGINTFSNLTRITYPTGASSNYTYEMTVGNQVRGEKEYYRIKTREDEAIDSGTNTIKKYNREIYSYINDPTGYPSYDLNYLPEDYTYNTTVSKDTVVTTGTASYTDKVTVSVTAKPIHLLKSVKKVVGITKTNISLSKVRVDSSCLSFTIDGAVSGEVYEFTYEYGKIRNTYTFNYKHLNINETLKAILDDGNVKLLRNTTYTYAFNKFPETVETKIYNMNDENYIIKKTISTYDSIGFGDLISYADELGNITSYEYYPHMYHLPKKISNYVDYIDPSNPSKGKIKQVIEYILDPTGKNIGQMVQKYVEQKTVNGSTVETVIKSITTDYLYEDSGYPGNLTKEIVTMEDGSKIERAYTYASSTKHAYPTTITHYVHDYDTLGQTARAINEYFTYDLYTGNKKTVKDGHGYVTTYSYDDLGRITKVDNPPVTKSGGITENTSILVSYNDTENYVEVTDEEGYKQRQVFDGLGRLIGKQKMKDDGSWITIETTHYNSLGQVDWTQLEKSSSEKYRTSYQYDVIGRVTKTTNPDTSYQTVQYVDALNKKIVTDEEGKKQEFYYDNVGNLTKEVAYPVKGITANQYTTAYEYNYDNKLNKVIDANNHETLYRYDGFGRLAGVINAKQELTQYKYDNMNNLIELTVGDKTTKRVYDELGRMIVEEYPGQRKEYFKYDDANNLKYKKDRKGQEFNYEYDERNRLRNYKLGTTTVIASYDYDKTGRVLWAQNPAAGRTSYEYYKDGSLKKVTESDGRYIIYEYDNLGNRTKMTDHFNKATDYGYDSRDRLKTVILGTNSASYTYYLDGSLKSITYPGGVKEEYRYDGANNLETLTNSKSGGTIIDQYAYTYDSVGNQKSKAENGNAIFYGYDALNRIQTVSTTNVAQPSPKDMIAAYTYDAEGNIDSAFMNTGLQMDAPANCKVNELNQMIEYTDPKGIKALYTYYPNGLRKTKTSKGITTTYYYDGQNVIIEAENDSLKYRNIYGMNQIARQDAAENTNYFLYNGHGDVVKTVDSAGNVKNIYEYDIYGKVTNAVENGVPNPMRYAGQMYDNESGLYYLRARYYDPSVGRFISEDTNKGDINNPSSLNLYTYCWGNPIRLYDPNGHEPIMLNEYSHVTEAEIAGTVSFVAGFTPIDVGKDFVDFIAGKDIITGEKMSRWVLAGCILGPEASDQLLRNGKKVVKAVGEALDNIPMSRLDYHFKKHKDEFVDLYGNLTKDGYLNKARQFVSQEASDNVEILYRSNGDKVIFNKVTQEFGVQTKDGMIKTYYIPDPAVHGYKNNYDYFKAQ